MDREQFMAAHGLRLLRLAYVLTGSQTDAEDLVQDCWLRAHQHWERVQKADNSEAYVRRILINQCQTRRRRRFPFTVPLSSTSIFRSGSSDLDQVAERHALRGALRHLPTRQRTAVVLRFYCDLEFGEIAREMGITESSVRSAVTRGLEHLRVALNDDTSTPSETTHEAIRN